MQLIFGQIIALLSFFVVFSTIEKLFAMHKEQKIFRENWKTDVVHFLCNRFLIDGGSFITILTVAILLKPFISADLQLLIASQPILLQFTEAVLIANFVAYWTHRFSHTIPFLWKFHSVHHSSENLDWLASARLHPIDDIFSRTIIFAPLYLLGFTKELLGSYIIFALLHGIFNHSNVRFQFGFLRWIIATPIYHHWHHSNHLQAKDKNFAGQFPIFDWIFGTLYLPKEKVPQFYGISELIPQKYTAQLIFPFRKLKN